jgi:hypothetical protein
MHGQHTKRFYWILIGSLLVLGALGGWLLSPDDWHIARKLLGGTLVALWCGFCVFAWHTLTDSIEEQ